MAYALDLCDAPITCHAWNADKTQLAICPNTNELMIYKVDGKKFELLYTLNEHTQVISAVDWHPVTDRIVTCSHDRNAYVWTLNKETNVWHKDLVILKLKRAATYCRWSPDGTKFVVATGTNKVRVCAWQEEHTWWSSFNISHNHPTGLTVDFFPDNIHLAVASTCRHAFYITIDDSEATKKKKKINYILDDWATQGWTNASAVSPSGEWIALTSQDSYIRFVKKEEFKQGDAPKHALNINGLPLLSIAFLNDNVLVGGGFDCAPRLFVREDGSDEWSDLGLIDIPEIREQASGPAKGGLASRMAAFGGKPAAPAAGNKMLHTNIILGVRVVDGAFTTCSNDGRIGVWPLEAIKKHFTSIKL